MQPSSPSHQPFRPAEEHTQKAAPEELLRGADMKKKTPLTPLGNTAAVRAHGSWQPAAPWLRLSKTFLWSWHEHRPLNLRLHEG